MTCGNPSCKCAKGERHGPIWYLTVTLGRGRTTGGIIPAEKVAEVRRWIENYHKVKDHLEKISEINRIDGKVTGDVKRATVYPAKHFVTSADDLERAILLIEQELAEQLDLFRKQASRAHLRCP